MDLELVRKYLEKDIEGGQNATTIDGLPNRFFEPFVMQGLRVDLVEPGRVICSMNVPPRLLVPSLSLMNSHELFIAQSTN